MNTTCVHEAYGTTTHIYEHEVARRWYALPADVLLPLANGDCCRLLFAGRPGSAAGPDVQDAVLHFVRQNVRCTGDVEFHVRARDWFTHQHHQDARYNNVLLHVVLICDTPAPTLRQDGVTISTCSLYDLPLPSLTRSQTTWPCSAVLPYMSDGECTFLLKQAGLLRFEQKAHTFVEQLHTARPHAPFSTYDVCLIVALAEGSGYGRNRAFFRAAGQYLLGLAGTLPEPLGHTFDPPSLDASRLSVLRKLVTQWRTRSAWEMMREAINVTAIEGGLVGKVGQKGETLEDRVGAGVEWMGGGDPCGRPLDGEWHCVNRSMQMGRRATTRVPTMPTKSTSVNSPCGDQAHNGYGHAPQINQLRAIFAGLGTARADILICNIVLPFAMAIGLIENDHALVEQAQTLYKAYPSLPSNRITRAMSAQLQLIDEPQGACQQQGLHYIYQQTCQEKRCEECIVGRRKL